MITIEYNKLITYKNSGWKNNKNYKLKPRHSNRNQLGNSDTCLSHHPWSIISGDPGASLSIASLLFNKLKWRFCYMRICDERIVWPLPEIQLELELCEFASLQKKAKTDILMKNYIKVSPRFFRTVVNFCMNFTSFVSHVRYYRTVENKDEIMGRQLRYIRLIKAFYLSYIFLKRSKQLNRKRHSVVNDLVKR